MFQWNLTSRTHRRHTWMARAAMAVATAAIVLLSACGGDKAWEKPGPRETFETFLMDLWRGNSQAAFEAIDPANRDEYIQPLDELRDLVPKQALPSQHKLLVAGRIDNPFDIRKIDVDPPVRSEPGVGDKVTLKLHYHDDRSGEATMVWGGERWYIGLPPGREGGFDIAPWAASPEAQDEMIELQDVDDESTDDNDDSNEAAPSND